MRERRDIETVSKPVGRLSAFFQRPPYAALAIILFLGLLARLIMLPMSGFSLDLVQHYDWANCGLQNGIFGAYICAAGVTHPPLSPTMLTISMGLVRALGGDLSYFDGNPAAVIALKLPNLLFETALICLFFHIAYRKARGWSAALVTAALYWNPGWAVVTAWWGQNDAHNFWFWVSGSSPTVLLDSLPLFGGISYFQAGLLLLVIGTAVVCWRAWAGERLGDEYLLFAVANFSFYMLPTQIQVRYLYPGLIFLALAMIRDWRLIVLYVVASLAFTHNVFATVWLGTGLLYYPSKLLFWQPVHDGLAMTVVYIALMSVFLPPTLRRRILLVREAL